MEDIYASRDGQTDDPHRHDYYTVILVEKARGRHVIDFKDYPLSGMEVFFISPGQVHQVIESEQSFGYSLVFTDEFLLESGIPQRFISDISLFNPYGECPPLPLDEKAFSVLRTRAEEMIEIAASEDAFRKDALGALLKLFLIACNQQCVLPPSDNPNNEGGSHLIRDFKSLIESNFRQWHQIAHYAEAMHVSADHLNRVIKAATGKTSKEHIQGRITTAAKRMLFFTEMSTKEIAFELGFSEPSNFSAFFKKCTGKSPSAFRADS